MSAKLYSQIVPVKELTPETKSAMFQLFAACFAADREIFIQDLLDKQYVILLYESETEALAGFTSLKIFDFEHEGRAMIVVYDGDTIIAPEHWGTTLLSKTWIKTVLEKTQDEERPVFWMLITSGYRTYRFLPVFYNTFYPRHDEDTPPETQRLMHAIATKLFGDEYQSDEGVVRFKAGATPLLDHLAEVDPGRLNDPHIDFFMQANPGHVNGDELVCLTEICDGNYTRAGKRMLR